MNLTATNNILEDLWIKDASVATVLEFQYDPIALACASYRIWLTDGSKFTDLSELIPTEEDIERAKSIRNYYRAKITWQMLQSQENYPVSEFRKKLMGIIEGTIKITTAELGILHRINFFYDEDLGHDAIFDNWSATDSNKQVSVLPVVLSNHRDRCKLLRTVRVSRRRYKNIEFWLEPQNSSAPCVIIVNQDNYLLSLISSVLEAGPVELIANWHPKEMPGIPNNRCYYQLTQPKMA